MASCVTGEEKGGENFFPNLPGHLVPCNNVESPILQMAELT